MKSIWSLDVFRGILGGLLGTGVGVGIAMLVRWAMGREAWDPGPVITTGVFVGTISWMISLGATGYWFRWVTGKPAPETY